MRDKLVRFMQGRYGVDSLSKLLVGVGLVSVVLSMFIKGNLFYYIGWVAIIYSYFRMFSRNVTKRAAENQWYLDRTYKLRCFIAKKKNQMTQSRTYHIYKCPSCKQKIRIPRGKGKIEVRCPKCGTSFVKRS